MMVTSSKQSKAPQAKKPQSCKHCGKFVIHTDGICDVYDVPLANMASSGIRDTLNMSVVFQNMDFGNDNDNTEYLFVNDFGNLDDSTRQLELYNRVCMEIQDVDAQPLRYGRHQYPGAVRADRPGNRICYAYLKPGEQGKTRHSKISNEGTTT